MSIIITCAMGLETVLKFELYDLGYKNLKVNNGFITVTDAIPDDAIQLALWCRTAARVFIELSQFKATTFDALFDAIYALPWADWLTADAAFTIDSVHSHQSDLFSQSDIQSITKKAIVTHLQKKYHRQQLPETGYRIPIRLHIQNNTVSVRLDVVGHGLNKRGYRTRFDAPLRETLAAAMIKLSRWDPANDVFMDPFCGSGTLLIEAAMMAHNIAPGLKQSFCSEHWPLLASAWPKAKKAATQQQTNPPFRIYGSDINADMLKTARFNLKRAGIDGVFVETKDAIQIQSRFDKGKIISNPPYGVRLDDAASVHQLIAKLGPHLRQYFPLWDYYFLSGDPQFQSYFNQKATKKRKLFNGTIQCHLYQYF